MARPVVERAGAGKLQREVAGSARPAQPRQQAAGLAGAGARARALRDRASRRASMRGLRGRPVEPLGAQREHRALAVLGGRELAREREARGLAEHRRAELDALDGEPLQLDRRQLLRQLGQPERRVVGSRPRAPPAAGAAAGSRAALSSSITSRPPSKRARRPGRDAGPRARARRRGHPPSTSRSSRTSNGSKPSRPTSVALLSGPASARSSWLAEQPLAGAGLREAEQGEEHQQNEAQRDP